MKADFRLRITLAVSLVFFSAFTGYAGVSRALQEEYKRNYENKALFLKIPIYAAKQMVYISGDKIQVEPGSGTPRYKVGDQMRILVIDFGNDEIKLRLSGIASPGTAEIGFRFDAALEENFPNRDTFDRALRSTFTQGVSYTDIEDAKQGFVKDEFDRSLDQIAASASTSRDSVLKTITPHIPAYQDAQRELDNLRNRVQDLTSQLTRSQSENRKLETESKHQQSEISRLKSANADLMQRIESSASQVSKLGQELKEAKGSAQGYQKELATIQRSLNLKVDTSRDLSSQIADLGQAMRNMQKENQGLEKQIASLRTDLDAQKTTNARLVSENDELKAGNKKMQSMISVLTSKEDSLQKQYFSLRTEKEKLDEFARQIKSLRTEIVEDKSEGGIRTGKTNLYLGNVPLGSLSWSIPDSIRRNESKVAEARFSSESIDRVKLTPEERDILRSLGEGLKIRVSLASGSDAVNISPGDDEPAKEIAERENAGWRWSFASDGLQDAGLILTAAVINKDSNEVPVFQLDHAVAASNIPRLIRGYLQPVPLIAGVLLGLVLFAIAGLFRRPKAKSPRGRPPVGAPPSSYTGTKQL
ncbi:MAG: hypothetical protein GXX84_12215 [Acidobacteria bacterium]|nr:hypothetical protein [Acidobacteriota bacterium]